MITINKQDWYDNIPDKFKKLYLIDNKAADKYPIFVMVGGRGSGKSYEALLFASYLCINNKNFRVVVFRKWYNYTKGIYNLLKDKVLKNKNINEENNLIKIYKSPLKVEFYNGSVIEFRGITNESSLKGDEPDLAIIEEFNDLTYDEFTELKQSILRNNSKHIKIIANCNPIAENHWIKHNIYDGIKQGILENVYYLWSNYKDNPYLPKEYVDDLEQLKYLNKRLYEINCLGKWGSIDEGLVFTNYDIVSNIDLKDCYDLSFGLDWGYSHYQSIILSGKLKKDNSLVILDEFCVDKLQNSDFFKQSEQHFGKLLLKNIKIMADSEDPKSINQAKSMGYNIEAVKKMSYQKQSIKNIAIDEINCNKLIITKKCKKLLEEISTYKYKFDKSSNIYVKELILKNDDCISAMLYSRYNDIYKVINKERDKYTFVKA